jgi:hypothetical protein
LDKLIFGDIYFKSIFTIFLNISKIAYKKVPALKGEVDSKTIVFEDGGVFLA